MDHKNILKCFKCRERKNLFMVGHRNKNGELLGFIFVCKDCMKSIGGISLEIKTKEGK